MEKLSRRNFFKLAGGGVAAALIAPKVLLDKIVEIPVEYGWTWHVDKAKIPGGPQSSFADIVTKTLRENAHKLQENIANNNALLLKLKDREKVLLRVERISPDEQTKRMTERLETRLKSKKYQPAYSSKQAEKMTFYRGYEDIEKKFLDDPYHGALDDPYHGAVKHIRAV